MKKFKPFLLIIELISVILVFFHFYNYSFAESYQYENLKTKREESSITFQSPKISLRKGIYDVNFEYNEDSELPSENVGTISLTATKGDKGMPRIECDEVAINNYQSKYKFRAHVVATDILSRITLKSDYDTLDITNLELTYNGTVSAMYYSFCLLMVLLLLDFVLFILPGLWSKASEEQRIAALAIAITSVVAIMPLFRYELTTGHDLRFHLTRIASIAEGIKDLQLPVRMESLWANNYGYATGMCYGGMLLYIPALLFIIGFSLINAYKIFLFLVTVLTAASSYTCFKKIAKDNYKIGIISMIMYTLSMYRLVDVYTRGAVGEYCAIAFIPFILLGAYELITDEKSSNIAFVSLVIGFTGLIETHVLSSITVTLFLLAFSLCYFKRFYRRENWVILIKAAGTTLLINAGFIIPFLDYYITVPMKVTTSPLTPIQGYGAHLTQLFQWFSPSTHGLSTALEGVYEMPLGLGTALSIFIVGVTCIIFVRGDKCRLKAIYPVLILTYVSLFMSTLYFPYDAIQNCCPAVFGIIGSVQFPWRYLSISVSLGTALFAYLIGDEKLLAGKARAYSCAMLLGIAVFQSTWFLNDFYVNAGGINNYDSNNVDKYVFFAEYKMEGTHKNLTKVFSKVTSENAGLAINSVDRNNYDFKVNVSNDSGADAGLLFPVWAYKGMRADSESGALSIQADKNNQLAVTVPAGYIGNIHVYFRELWYWRMSEIISLVSIIAFLINRISSYRRQKSQFPSEPR